MKRTLLFLIAFVALLTPGLGMAASFSYFYEDNTLLYYVLDEEAKTCMVYSYEPLNTSNLIIPEIAIKGSTEYTVTTIQNSALKHCKNLRSVKIPNSVTTIGKSAFYNCGSLTSVEIPNSITYIGDQAFSHTGITSVVVPSSVTHIGSEAFSDCGNLIKLAYPKGSTGSYRIAPYETCVVEYEPDGVIFEDGCIYGPDKNHIYYVSLGFQGDFIIPESVTSIGIGAFFGCSGLTSVNIPNSVTVIDVDVFSGCSGLTSVNIPNYVTVIGAGAFSGCSGLTSVNIPNSVSVIDAGAFSGCSGLTSVNIPNSVTVIGAGAFSECSGLTSVNIPNSVSVIDVDVFSGCSGLTSVVIPNSVTTIASAAFNRCSALTSLIVGNSVRSIAGNNFNDCSNLISVAFLNNSKLDSNCFKKCNNIKKFAYPESMNKPLEYGNGIPMPAEGLIYEDGVIYGPGKTTIYFAPIDFSGECVVPETVSAFSQYAFAYCDGLTGVTVKSSEPPIISSNTFYNLYKSALLTIPDNAVSAYICSRWKLFDNIKTADGMEPKSFSDGVFNYLLNTVDKTAIIIGAKDSYNLQIPERFTDDSDSANPIRYYIKGIGYKAFSNQGTKSVEFNSRSQVEFIGDDAFAGSTFSSISFPESVRYIGSGAFKENFNLESLNIPVNVTEIQDSTFYNCKALTNVVLNDNLVSIGKAAFSLKDYTADSEYGSLTIPASLKECGENAFRFRTLYKVIISDLKAWFEIDFKNKDSNPGSQTWKTEGLYLETIPIKDLIVPDGIEKIKPYAFDDCQLKSVELPQGIKEIGDYAFDNNRFKSLVIPPSVKRIARYAFGSVYNSLDELFIQDGIDSIVLEENSFYSTSSLYLGRPLAEGCSMTESCRDNSASLKELIIGNSVKELQNGVFKDCNKLSTLKLGSSLQLLGDNAFSGCAGLEEVILPPSVETIGAETFAGNSKLASIIMGHSVKSIGEKAFDGCPANKVSITAQTPPTAPNNTFSNYSGKLYVQGEKAKDAYYDAFTCWDRFDAYVMIEAEEIKIYGADNISGNAGDTFQLTASVWPENVTLPQIFWRSTNPEIATVDANGLVTLQVDLDSLKTRAQGEGDIAGTCTIIAETLYNDGPVAQVAVDAEGNGVVLIEGGNFGDGIDYSTSYEVYNLNGMKVGESKEGLAKGIYIVRQGKASVKIAVR